MRIFSRFPHGIFLWHIILVTGDIYKKIPQTTFYGYFQKSNIFLGEPCIFLDLRIFLVWRKWLKINFKEKVYFTDPYYFCPFFREVGSLVWNILFEQYLTVLWTQNKINCQYLEKDSFEIYRGKQGLRAWCIPTTLKVTRHLGYFFYLTTTSRLMCFPD